LNQLRHQLKENSNLPYYLYKFFTINWYSSSFAELFLKYLRGRSQITSRFRGGGGVGEFVTVQTQNFSFFGKFVTRGGGGSKKSFFLRDVICERPLILWRQTRPLSIFDEIKFKHIWHKISRKLTNIFEYLQKRKFLNVVYLALSGKKIRVLSKHPLIN